MGKGIDAARAAAPIHASVLDDFKDQLLIVLLKRLADKSGRVDIPVAEVDATGGTVISFAINDGKFNFLVKAKH